MIAKGPFRQKIHMVGIVKAIVVVVVAGCRCDGRDQVEILQLDDLMQIAVLNHQVNTLRHVCSVQVVMIGDIRAVTTLDLSQKVDQFVIVETDTLGQSRLERKVVHHLVNQDCESVLSSKFITHSEAVKVELIHRL